MAQAMYRILDRPPDQGKFVLIVGVESRGSSTR